MIDAKGVDGGELLEIYGKTDVGRGRDANQDCYYYSKFSPTIGFAVVCDGMGGQNSGNVASELVRNCMMEELTNGFVELLINPKTVQKYMFKAVSKSNNIVYGKSMLSSEYTGMGTTLIATSIIDEKAYIVHVGDSRVYLFRDNKLNQITVDHSLVQELFEQGKITKKQMETHPQKNMITRVIGVGASVDVDYLELEFLKGDVIMLCSDGLTNMCSDEVIESIIENNVGEDCTDKLIKMANKAGGRDNITVVMIDNRIVD